ncbi:MAG TPA: type II toxin-antitoxin system HicA family toxin, partial [Aggregatilineales bacterium]|nr:type II toxin-antitoxin system HicA family toxin [Aggregatilineales bacterium]
GLSGRTHRLMKRTELLQHLQAHGCELLREGSRHSWWHNTILNKRSAVPRHNEISDILAKKICRDLGIPPVK